MNTLLVGFDSAWTPTNPGAIAGLLRREDGTVEELMPEPARFGEAIDIVRRWQADSGSPAPTTVIMIDQPTIVTNERRQRDVENVVAAPVSLRYGGVQPSNLGRDEMFGPSAEIWKVLAALGGAADPLAPLRPGQAHVFETYPVLALIALDWLRPDERKTGRLPKYNPARKTFNLEDWRFLCTKASESFKARNLDRFADWCAEAGLTTPKKSDQDNLDACLCLLVALAREDGAAMMVGNVDTGYMVVPHSEALEAELVARCLASDDRPPTKWIRRI